MKKYCILLMAFVLLFFSSCFWDSFWEWVNPDDRCTLEQRDYVGDNLRIDGYYYEDVENDYATIYILYKNGVVLSPPSTSQSEMDKYYNELVDKVFWSDNIDMWGLFAVEDSLISLEYYLPSMYGHHTYLMRGTILNDSTFRMIEGRRSVDSKYESIDHLFRFRQTEVKPDSTNRFFK